MDYIASKPSAEECEPVAAAQIMDFASGGSRRFLIDAATKFAKIFEADRCSIFLYDYNSGLITLRAAYGFKQFGRATIVSKIGDCLEGRVLAERRPIYTESASSMRGYVAHPNFPDDEFQTFLGIPLLNGRDRVGVIVLRRRTGRPFLAKEISNARTRAQDMLAAIQNAGALLLAQESDASATSPLEVREQVAYRGLAVSNGWAMGPVKVIKPEISFSTLLSSGKEFPNAIRSLDDAVKIVEDRLRQSTSELDRRLPEAASMIFEASALMLHDENFTGRIEKLAAEGMPITKALAVIATEYIKVFSSSDNEYLREKVRDIEDLAQSLMSALTEADPMAGRHGAEKSILVAERILPSDVLRVALDKAAGIILCAGGATAHVSLLVRSLRIPMIIVKSRSLLRLGDGELAIIDCANSAVYLHPDEALIRKFSWRANEEAAEQRTSSPMVAPDSDKTCMRDGESVVLAANINILSDLDLAIGAHAEGVGLYRTEFPFLMRQNLPTEAEQVAIYLRVLESMPSAPVTFRTLDAGGDKMLPYLFKAKEDNPALGMRSIRLSLKYPYILDQQLRAILRAIQITERDDVSIMFPMISSIEEFRIAREHVDSCMSSLQTELGDRQLHQPFVGAMVEVPAALSVLDALAEESDFFSIGTNDLAQYLLAVDRTNEMVSDHFVCHHPAILQALKNIATTAIRHNTPVSVCGEMGRDPRYLPFLIGIGIRDISLEPAQITKSRELVSCLTVERCESYAQKLLSLYTIAEIEECIDAFSKETFG